MSMATGAVGLDAVRLRWQSLSLVAQFMLVGLCVLVAGMLMVGTWVTGQIRNSVVHNTAAATALYVDSIIAPLLPDVVEARPLDEGPRQALDETLSQGLLGNRLVVFKIWRPDGTIIYANEPDLIGRRFPISGSLARALSGRVAAEFDDLDSAENVEERQFGVPLLEIYSPVRAPWTGEVTAVAEFYERAEGLTVELSQAMLASWLVVAAVTLAMMGLLSGIVWGGSRTIKAQRHSLQARVDELSRLLAQNRELRHRVESASRRAVALNESFLRRISADLHDGPAQLLAVASLRLGSERLTKATGDTPAEIAGVRALLDETMSEIRDICHGLGMPHVEQRTLHELIADGAQAHERRTGTEVAVALQPDLPEVGPAEKICVYRFIQEGLNNAFRHAGGRGQRLAARCEAHLLTITVTDSGGGLGEPAEGTPAGLGLAGLRERVRSLGGQFSIASGSGGTRLSMQLDVSEGGPQ